MFFAPSTPLGFARNSAFLHRLQRVRNCDIEAPSDVRNPTKEAFEIYSQGTDRIVAVSDDEVAEAMRIYYRDTHNVAEGAGAASLAALLQEHRAMRGKTVGVILSGGNVDTEDFVAVLQGRTPKIS